MDKKAIGSAFKRVREERGWILRDVEKASGGTLDPGMVSKIENGVSEPLFSTAWRLAQALDTSLDSIAGEASGSGSRPAPLREVFAVPVLSWPQIEALPAPVTPEALPAGGPAIHAIDRFGPGAFAFTVNNDAMQTPGGLCYPEGVTVIADPSIQGRSGAAIVARLTGTGEVLFRQLVQDGRRTYLRALNAAYPMIPADQGVEVLGTVVGMAWRMVDL